MSRSTIRKQTRLCTISPLMLHTSFQYKPSFTSTSEQIAKYIIEKLISLSINKHFINKIENEIGTVCYKHTTKILNTLMESQFIMYDKDEQTHSYISDINNNNSNINKRLFSIDIGTIEVEPKNEIVFNKSLDLNNKFFNNMYNGENNWNNVNEPSTNTIDRYASTLPITFDKSMLLSSLEMKIKTRTGSLRSDLYKVNEEDPEHESSTLKAKRRKISSNKLNNVNGSSKIIMKESDVNKKRNLLEIINEMSFHDLPKEIDRELLIKDVNFEELRKEKEEMDKKAFEEKNKLHKRKIEIETKQKEEIQKNRELEKKKLTVDAKGNIVFIKPLNIDMLQTEFTGVKHQFKSINVTKAKPYLIKKRQSVKDNGNSGITTTNNVTNSSNIHLNDNKKNTTTTTNNNINNYSPSSKRLPKLHIRNNGRNVNTKLMFNSFISNTKNDDALALANKYERQIEKGPIHPSGSCFDIITPEVGVSITENTKIKSGGKDFYSKYKKYTVDNYNKQLKDTLMNNNNNNNSLLTAQYKSQSNIFTNTEYNFNSSTSNNINNNYNNLYTDSSCSKSGGGGVSTGNIFRKKSVNYFTHVNASSTKMNANINTSYNPLIKVNSMNSILLRNALDTSTADKKDEEGNTKLNRVNIFKDSNNSNSSSKQFGHTMINLKIKTFSNRMKESQLGDINTFTSHIMTDNNWGKDLGGDNNNNNKYTNRIKGIRLPFATKISLKHPIIATYRERKMFLSPSHSNITMAIKKLSKSIRNIKRSTS